MNDSGKPVKELRSHGIKASVWQNDVEFDGRTIVQHSVRIKKRYYDKEANEWKDTDYYYESDLFRLILVASKALAFIAVVEKSTDDTPFDEQGT